MSNTKTVDTHTLKQWMDNNEAMLIDVREADEYKEAHIAGSILIPLAECSADRLPHAPDKKLVIHCKKGKRGEVACTNCMSLMPGQIIWNLEGGIDAWIADGYDVNHG